MTYSAATVNPHKEREQRLERYMELYMERQKGR